MNVLIVEKEKREALKLTRILRLVDPSITVLETVESFSRLISWIQKNPSPDIVLVNHTRMPELSMHNAAVLAKLVLHTKQHSLTYLAFRTNTISQLKPHGKLPRPHAKGIEFAPAPAKEEEQDDIKVATVFKNRFFVESGQRFLSVSIKDIAYFFSDGRFVYFTTFAKNKYIIHYRMEELVSLLNPEDFYRINRSFIVSVNAIAQIHPYFGSRFKLKLLPAVQEEILVSRNRAPGFRKWLGE
jgi:two-component system response regulator LytT